MSDSGRDAKPPRRAVKPGEDPWAKWRKAEGGSPAEAPAEAPVKSRTLRPARPAEKPAAPKRPAQPAHPPADRPLSAPAAPYSAPAAAGAPREGVRLSKVMSERGICSRREADLWIERGWVFVDGQRISELGTRIDPSAEITLASGAKEDQARQVTILLNKPVGYVSGQPEPGSTPAVVLITGENQVKATGDADFKPYMLRNLAPAGRLDVDSTGLLVLTQDGRVAKLLIGDDSKVEKEYLVRVSGQIIANGLELLNHGLELDGKPLKPARVKQLNEDQLHFILKEGKKRQIRRMCELVGLRVTGLKRVRVGRLKLGDLPPGKWRLLRDGEGF